MSTHNHNNEHHDINNEKKYIVEFIVFSKEKQNGIYPIINVFIRILYEHQIQELKNKDTIDMVFSEIRLPLNPKNNELDKSCFILMNRNNINFFDYEVTDYSENDVFWFNPLIDIKKVIHQTSYYNFFWKVLHNVRKKYLRESDWLFLNISDRKIKFSEEKKKNIEKLRQELRDINKTYNNSNIRQLLQFNYDSWGVNVDFTNKYEPLLNN
tara:strand:+ start:10383 stop:11015 length:633 start_codon:yes stop_codon:yes gene_type:complete